MSNTFDGVAETAAIKAALAGLVGGRVYTSLPADAAIPRNTDGSCKPYIVLLRGAPVAAASGRSLSGSERSQPQNMMWTANSVAGTADDAEVVMSAALGILMGFVFTSGNATPLKTFGSFNLTDHATTTAPERVTFGVSMSSVINLNPGSA